MSYIFLIMFIITSAVHLYALAKSNDFLRYVTKGWLLLELALFYISYVSGAQEPMLFLVLALIFSWLGDIFLISKKIYMFATGGICFLIGHIFFILTYCKFINFSIIPIWFYTLLLVIDIVAVFIYFKGLKPHLPKPLVIPMFLYLLTNGLMNCFSWYHVYSNFSIGALITAIGALSFFISDSSLFIIKFKKTDKTKSHLIVMSTYIVAELLIVVGLMMVSLVK